MCKSNCVVANKYFQRMDVQKRTAKTAARAIDFFFLEFNSIKLSNLKSEIEISVILKIAQIINY